jgi:hypothetical protein
VHGDLKEGKFNTIAPVVLMMLALWYGHKTKCNDFSNAFVRAKLTSPVWIHLLHGDYSDVFGPNTEGKCLELKKANMGCLWLPSCGIYIYMNNWKLKDSDQVELILACIPVMVWPLLSMLMTV